MVVNFSIHRKIETFGGLQQVIIFFYSTIEVKSYNRQERRDTYNVIGIMKGDVEPGTMSSPLHKDMIGNFASF
jgi:hypothetical protein